MISRLFCATGAVKSFHWVVSIGVGVGTLLGCGSLATAGVRPAAFQNTGEGPAQDSLPDPRQLVGGSSPGNPPTATDQTVPLAAASTLPPVAAPVLPPTEARLGRRPPARPLFWPSSQPLSQSSSRPQGPVAANGPGGAGLDDATVQELMQLRQRLGTGIGDPADFRAALEQVARGPLADHHPVPSGGPTLAAAENGGLIPQTEFPQPAALANMGPRPGMSHHHRRAARALEEAAWELEWAGDYPWADQLRHQAAELYRRAR